jgi:hypothetical protein
MVARRDQRAVDDPGLAEIMQVGVACKHGQQRSHRLYDAVCGGLGDREARGELADREMRAQGSARDQHAVPGS